jgi:2-dehydro-3-deoxyphosphooctonate aldolase (KDO 8-P synthase)
MGPITKPVQINEHITIGGDNPIALIAGPCVIEDETAIIDVAAQIKQIAAETGIPFIFKSSFDKANRSSLTSYRGPGLNKGLQILAKIKSDLDLPLLTDIHTQEQAAAAAEIVDIIQIPAFLCRQTDLLVAAAKTMKPVNVKKGQFLAPLDIKNIIDKITQSGNDRLLITERGTSFGYNTLISDMRALPIMRELGCPVIFDATHSVQQPGGLGGKSGGESRFVPALARAAIAVGCDALFLEVHTDPEKAKSDGPNMIPISELKPLLQQLRSIEKALA